RERRMRLQRVEHEVPRLSRGSQGVLHIVAILITLYDRAHRIEVVSLAQQEHHLDLRSRLDADRYLERCRRIKTGPAPVVERDSSQRRGMRFRSVAPQKLRPVAGVGSRPRTGRSERDLLGFTTAP